MGQQPPRKQPPTKSIDDQIMDMKINAKQIERASKNSEKEKAKFMKQAKDSLRKGQQDFAQLYLSSASQKHQEALNYHRTAIKIELMCDQIKSMKSNEKMVATFGQLSNAVSMQMGQTDAVKMAENMAMFNQKMDETLINNKMMTELMQGSDIIDNNVDSMLEGLKQQLALEEANKMNVVIDNNNKNKIVDKPVVIQQPMKEGVGNKNPQQPNKKQNVEDDQFFNAIKDL